MKAPRIDGFINRYHREQYALDEKSKELLRKLYSLIDLIEPCGDDDKHILWLREERGTIEDYGNLDELIEDGIVDNKEQFEKYTKVIYFEARLIEGLPIDNPTEMSNLMCDIMADK